MKSITQPSGASHIAIGDIVVSAVNDGVHEVSFDDLVTTDRAACKDAHLGEFRLAPPWLTINCFVIRSSDRLVLVDSGFAGKAEHVGRLAENLKAISSRLPELILVQNQLRFGKYRLAGGVASLAYRLF